jgi:hypothetical protein
VHVVNRKFAAALAATVVAGLAPTAARAEPSGPAEHDGIAAEVNVLWPFIGISELKLVVPVVHDPQLRGEVIIGTYLDYAQIVRDGRAFIIAALPGYRQFVFHGLHVELAATVGVRHEAMHPPDGATLDDFYIRAWPGIGYEYDVTPRFYANARARLGVLVYRQTHQDEEKKLAPAGDLNLGVRF